MRSPDSPPKGDLAVSYPLFRFAYAILVVPFVLCHAPETRGQWSVTPNDNLTLADGGKGQAGALLSPTADGGCWISWLEEIAGTYEVRVQRLDVGGVEQLPHGGVLVAGDSYNFQMDAGASGAALIVHRDQGGAVPQITAVKIAADGTLPWGAAGVKVSEPSELVFVPRVAVTSDGGAVVAWWQDGRVMLRRLSAEGGLVGERIELTPSTGSYGISDLHAAGDDVIVSLIHVTDGYGSPSYLLAQKYDAAGSALWGTDPVAVFDGGSLQFNVFPRFAPDGSGGAVFAWHELSSSLQCSVQRLSSDGCEVFAHDGVPVSDDLTRMRANPTASYDVATGETVAFWVELTFDQEQFGVYGQKFDAAGERLWGDNGAVVRPVGPQLVNSALHVRLGEQVLVVWDEGPAFDDARLKAALVDASGAVTKGPFDVSSAPSAKSRLALVRTTAGFGAVAWDDDNGGAGDVQAQNINADGSLGPRWTELLGGTPGVAGVPVLSGNGPLTAGSTLGVSLSSAPPDSLALLWMSLASMPAPTLGGTLHAHPAVLELPLVTTERGGFTLSATMPAGVPSGTELTVQFICQDPSSPYGKTLSNSQRGTTP
jgi:hypothetical protein